MKRARLARCLAAACFTVVATQADAQTAAAGSLTGIWTLNREASQFHEVGFGLDTIPPGGEVTGGINPGWVSSRPLSEADARNMRQLVGEVRNPPAFLAVAQDDASVTVLDDRNRVRAFRPDGREETQRLDAGPVRASARWEGVRLVIQYRVAEGREIRYSLWRKSGPVQLVVQAELIERGGHDTIVRVYEPAKPGETLVPSKPEPPATAGRPSAALPSQPSDVRPGAPADAPAQEKPVPAAGGGGEPFDQRPDAELKGLRELGLVVEGLGDRAAACGLTSDAIEAAVSKPLTDAGLKVARHADEDSFLYVNVITASTSAGLCFSRYDAQLYTTTTATLSYGSSRVLVQALLMQEGGVAGGAPADHGASVMKALAEAVGQFATRIRDANR